MLERETDLPPGWRLDWIERTWLPLDCYMTLLSLVLAFTVIALGLAAFFIIRNANKKIKSNPSQRAAISAHMHKKVLKLTKSHFGVAIVYLIHAFALALVDGFIAVVALRDDFKSNAEEYNSEAWMEIGLYCLYLTVLFVGSFFLIPLLQMLLVTWSLAKVKKSGNCSTLADYIPEARFTSTAIAQMWCASSFLTTWTSPDHNGSSGTFRFVVLQACVGSAVAWLQASFAFNFCADALEDIDTGSNGVQEALSMFQKTATVVYTNKLSQEKLPLYEDEPSQTDILNEKS